MPDYTGQKITGNTKMQKTQFERTEEASKPDSHMAGMLKVSDGEFKSEFIC